MPNWCLGQIEVSGKAKDVEAFCKHFIFTEEVDKEGITKKYFARSFTNTSWDNFYEDYLKDTKPESHISIDFSVDFAWSCHTCMIDGYPYKKGDKKCKEEECITLEWACKEHQVDVHITTEETGCCFEEDISCNSKGELTEECNDMPTHECQNCGNKQAIPSSQDLDDEECCECGACAWTDKLKDMLEKKLQSG